MKKLITLLISAILATGTAAALAHSGGTDAQGCHVDRRSGVKHCH
ncbi:YHYH domain-containing protein [Azotobacter chroococcum]|uniref:YHYH domain-containing protein n=1 Tax=Azotobacter chroococcum TaxID=353 RepID=A0A4R1PPX0_9GAMM|nr:YHYH domain-containing protein [Azotobacter chroococcum]TBV91337.1 YHYH domain-containing protein [Azotobacter chroococcum]TCL32507.1 hypothetical protein EV691_10733 [Azotobacter chroococcum]